MDETNTTTVPDQNGTAGTVAAAPVRENERTFTLPNGSVCHVSRAKGKHSMQAADLALSFYGKQPTQMQVLNCLMSLVTTIGDEGVTPLDLEDLWSEDYTQIQIAYMDLNGGF